VTSWIPISRLMRRHRNFAVLRLLLILSLNIGAKMKQFDITQAFQHPQIDEKICFSLPSGFSLDGCKYAVANKGLQGLKQGAHLWYKEYDQFCLDFDKRVQKSEFEPCLYFIWTPTLKTAWSIHVDDNFGFSDPPSFFESLMDAAEKRFGITRQNSMTTALGMSITPYPMTRHPNAIICTHEGKLQDIEDRFQISELSFPVKSPMCWKTASSLCRETIADRSLPFMSLLMSLMWIAMCYKPELLFACKYMARYGQNFDIAHYRALTRIARFACDAKHQGLVIRGWSFK
jgi:hypothetical protein